MFRFKLGKQNVIQPRNNKYTIRFCKNCTNSFEIAKSRLKHGRGIYCSSVCSIKGKSVKRTKHNSFKCLNCSLLFERAISYSKNKKGAGKYCSRECRDNHWLGSNTSNWQNANREYKRGPNWASVKRKAKQRDKSCKNCNSIDNLHVHHIVPYRLFECYEIANDLSNLVTLCGSCHRKEESKYKWVKIDEDIALMLPSTGHAWELIKEKGML